MILGPQRYSRVVWLDQSDLEPYGDPETRVEVGAGAEVTHGLHILRPFGRDTDAMLSVHAVRESGRITLAITTMVAIDQAPYPVRRNYQPYIDNRQSGTDRNPRSQADGFHDDMG